MRRLFFLEALAVGTFIHGGMMLVGSHLDFVQRTVVVAAAMVCAGFDGTADAVIGMFHSSFPPVGSYDRFALGRSRRLPAAVLRPVTVCPLCGALYTRCGPYRMRAAFACQKGKERAERISARPRHCFFLPGSLRQTTHRPAAPLFFGAVGTAKTVCSVLRAQPRHPQASPLSAPP